MAAPVSNWTRVMPQVKQYNQLAQMVNQGVEPTPIPGSAIRPGTGGVNVVPGQGGVTVIPARPNPQRPSVEITGGGFKRPGFNPFISSINPYANGVWNPGMTVGSPNSYGGTYRGLSYGPNEAGGMGWHTVFSPGGSGGAFSGGGDGSNFGVTRNMGVGFGGFPSLGMLSQKFA